MKKIILTLLGATITSTSVFAMEKDTDKYPYKKLLITSQFHHAPSDLELYEAGKIDMVKGRGSKQDFLYTNETQYLTKCILFEILDRRRDATFFSSNGKVLQVSEATVPEEEFPYSVMTCNPLSEKNSQIEGWYFKGKSLLGDPIYFEITEVSGSQTKKMKWEEYWAECNDDSDNNMIVENLKKRRF
jgi:hypothetical protein